MLDLVATACPTRPPRAPATGRAAALVGAFALLGCGEQGGGIPPGRVTPEVEATLAHLPGDAWAVLGIDAARARRIPALGRLLAWLPAPPFDPPVAGGCGLDPAVGVDRAVATLGRGADPGAGAFIALAGRFTRASVERCIGELARTGRPVSAARHGALTVYRDGGGESYAYWPTGSLVVVAPRAEGGRAALAELAAPGGARRGAGLGAALGAYLARVRTDAVFWMAGPLPPAVQERMAEPGVPALRGFFVSVDADRSARGARVLVGLRMAGEDEAADAAAAFRAEKPALARAAGPAAAIVDRFEVARDGADVAVAASLSAAELDLLVDAIARMAPGGGLAGRGAP
jgi:hypothetical protein